MDYYEGINLRELLNQLDEEGEMYLEEDVARIYISEIILAIEELHNL